MKEKNKPVIYSITNIIDNKKYVGSAVDYNVRRVRHLSNLRCNKHHSSYLQNSFNKHGEPNFVFDILEIVDDVTKLIEAEQKWIDNIKPEFNMTLIAGLNSHLGLKRSNETKQKMSQARIGMVFSQEHKDNISKSKKGVSINGTNMNKDKIGKPLSTEQKNKIKLSNQGKIVSDETKKKISETLKNKVLVSAVAIRVEKYSLDDKLIAEYKSIKDAEIDNGYGRDSLRYHILTKAKTEHNGFKWRIKKLT